MPNAVKRTISLPSDLVDEIDEISRIEGKSVSAVIQEALRLAHSERLRHEFKSVQGYWSKKAREKGILTKKDLRRLLGERRSYPIPTSLYRRLYFQVVTLSGPSRRYWTAQTYW